MSAPIDLAAFQRDGWVVVRSLFSAGEVQELRDLLDAILDRERAAGGVTTDPRYPNASFVVGDLLGKAQLGKFRHVIFEPRVLECARELLGPQLVYFGDSSVQMGEGIRGYHKDNVDRGDPQGPDWKSSYTLLRFGLYLENHVVHSGGLKLRSGSHNLVPLSQGEALNVKSSAGDLVIWNMRITHSGNSVLLKAFPNLCLPPLLERLLPGFLRVPEERERKAVFWSLGAPGPHVDRFIDSQTKREDCREHWRKSCVNAPLLEMAKAACVELRVPIPEYGSEHPEHQLPAGAR